MTKFNLGIEDFDTPTAADKAAIADLMGLSQRTVDRVFKGESEKSREEVIEGARRHFFGIAPAGFVGLVRPDAPNPFFDELVRLVRRRLTARRLMFVVARSDPHDENELTQLKQWIYSGVTGVFYAQNPPSEDSIRFLVDDTKTPVVLVDVDPDASGLSKRFPRLAKNAVLADNDAGIQQAVRMLHIAQGHETIAFLEGPPDVSTAIARRDAFIAVAKRYGLPRDNHLFLKGDYSYASGKQAAYDLDEARKDGKAPLPSAVVCANDLMACGLIAGLNEANVDVPGQLSVVGFDHIAQAAQIALVTMDQRIEKIADAAARNMFIELGLTDGGADRHAPREPRRITPELSQGVTVRRYEKETSFEARRKVSG